MSRGRREPRQFCPMCGVSEDLHYETDLDARDEMDCEGAESKARTLEMVGRAVGRVVGRP